MMAVLEAVLVEVLVVVLEAVEDKEHKYFQTDLFLWWCYRDNTHR